MSSRLMHSSPRTKSLPSPATPRSTTVWNSTASAQRAPGLGSTSASAPPVAPTVYWDFAAPGTGSRTFLVAVGNFEDPDFPMPTVEVFTKFRHCWVRPVPDAVQVFDPLDSSAPIDSMLPTAHEAGT